MTKVIIKLNDKMAKTIAAHVRKDEKTRVPKPASFVKTLRKAVKASR